MTKIKLNQLSLVRRLVLGAIAVSLAGNTTVTDANNEAGDQVDLKTFGQQFIKPYDGCRFAFWSDSVKATELELSYYFFAPFNDGEMLPGWIKVGERIEELERKDSVGADGLFDAYQLFQNSSGEVTLILEIKEYRVKGDLETVADARITVIEKGKVPFMSDWLEGHLFCPQAYVEQYDLDSDQQINELSGDPILLYRRENYDDFDKVPRPIIEYINNTMQDCDLSGVPEFATSHRISEAMTLWELPCTLLARNASSVFFTSLDDNPDHFMPLAVTEWPLSNTSARTSIVNATVEQSSATISSVSLGPMSDCGTYEVHQLRAMEGESVELKLLEYREKVDCDGIQTDPKEFPLVFPSQ